MNNMEIVNKALKTLLVPLQDYVISEMKFKFGENWWKKAVVDDKAIPLPIDVPRMGIDDDMARPYMDVPRCMALIFHYGMINDDAAEKGIKDQLQYINDLKVHGTDYKYQEAQDAIRTMMAIDDLLMLDCQEELQQLYDSLTDNRQKKKNSDSASGKKSEDDKDKSNAPVPTTVASEEEADLKTIAIMACNGMIDQLTKKQQGSKYDTSRTIINVERWNPREGGFKLKLDKEVFNPDSLGLMIDGTEYNDSRVSFDNYNKYTNTIMMYFSGDEDAELLMNNCHTIQLFSDMKWLVNRTLSFFEQYGDLLGYPPNYSSFAVGTSLINIGLDDSNEQDRAVSMALSKPLSYVWGVPGSGKTQAVLARAINESVKRGERVAVIAPTNNALEQVIRGLIKAFKSSPQGNVIDPGKDIIRIGTPTSEFIKDFSGLCEPKGVQIQLQKKMSSLSFLLNLRSERAYDRCRPLVEELMRKADSVGDDEDSQMQFYQEMKPILDIMKEDQRYAINAKTTNHKNAVVNIKRIYNLIYGHDRSSYTDEEVKEISDEELDARIEKNKAEIEKIRQNNPNSDISTAKVIAMTLAKFIISFGPFNTDRRAQLDVDRIFVDEAGYCNDVQTLSLLTLGKPLTMLGDHMQLPPVCEIDRKELLNGIEANNEHRYDFLWDLSALYVDHFFDEDMKRIAEMYRNDEDPDFPYTSRQELTKTYRFGDNLARILGKFVYDLGMTSNSTDPLKIKIIDAPPQPFPYEYGEVKRKNIEEARAVQGYIENNIGDDEDFVILTPYSDQVRCLKSICKKHADKIMTIHKSQGREWDTVIISICDCSKNKEADKVPRFTSTKLVEEGATPGIKVLNTAISRAKLKLVVVCDVDYWMAQDGELLAELILEEY